MRRSLAILLLAALPSFAAGEPGSGASFYEREVLPILQRNCFECHSHDSGKAKGGLVLDSRAAILSGGDSGPALVPGDPDKSLLIQAVLYKNPDLQMPPKTRLEEKQIGILTTWIKNGATTVDAQNDKGLVSKFDFGQIKQSSQLHWAFQPLAKPAAPASDRPDLTEIDRFIWRKQSEAGIEAVGPANRRTLARRLYFDLIGLPPTPEEVEAFVKDPSERAVETLVDRLLRLPEFGERWGRYWLDVARYADSNGGGSESNNTHDDAWRYRDYVITAFGQDKPFDQFVFEQIAGDLLEWTSEEQRRAQLIATGFLLLGPKAFGTGDWEQFRLDTIDEQLDTIGKTFLGLAIGCARCHDHKFDPISTRDYYSMAGVLASTFSVERQKGWRQGRTWSKAELPIDADLAAALKESHQYKLDHAADAKPSAECAVELAKNRLEDLKEKKAEAKAIAEAEKALAAAKRALENSGSIAKVLPIVSPVPTAMAVRDETKPVDEAIRIRGVPKSKGEVVPRGVLTLFGTGDSSFTAPANSSGRLQLARWLTDADRGAGRLVARVFVNRVWGHLIGRPIVESPDNFGLTGQPPTHPQLLDYLAASFVEDGWSLKRLVRRIALTRVYQLASADSERGLASDPGNQLLWRHQVRRLDAEAIRDALLSISGQLDRTRGGLTLQHQGLISFRSDYVTLETPSPYFRRTVYLPLLRDAIGLNEYADEAMGLLETFDFADMNLVTGQRNSTTVPTQALFLMNSPFMQEQSRALAKRLIEKSRSAAARVEHLFLLAYGRQPNNQELLTSLDYLFRFGELDDKDTSDHKIEPWASLCQAIIGSNEFLFLN